jgi:DNA-directed RNA polymerase subunit beta'
MKKIQEEFDFIKISLASPEILKKWAERILPDGKIIGEVKKTDTINYRTFKPEMKGLFCERIFGPIKSGECSCGLYKHARKLGFICEVCGVEITDSRVRRHRMGYIKLLSSVTHVWYLKGRPSYLGLILKQKVKHLESIIYFNGNLEKKNSKLNFLKNFTNFDNNENYTDENFLKVSRRKHGAELIQLSLSNLNLKEEIIESRLLMLQLSGFKKEREKLRIRVLESFLSTNSSLSWMVLSILPVIPPGLRPMIQLEGGRFATSDLNELYRRIITRNNRLLRLLEIDAPQLIIRNEKRMLQEAVDTLIDNGKRGKIALSANNRPLKSLSDIIKGKHGRFRQNLLGKRVDYSGRSVIVVGPSLKLNQCGLPYEMAIELFQPFIIRELINQGLASNMKIAKNLIQQNETIMVQVFEKVLKNHPIFLNRAPTLHRLGIQAFEPVLIQGRAIKLHPLVCSAFNADFDGDQMAVHIPLSLEAQAECYMLMLAPYNFLSPANGEPIIVPSQDMVLGCYYLTLNNIPKLLGSNHYFANLNDVILAYNQEQLEVHSCIWVRYSTDINNDSNLIKRKELNDKSFIEYYKNLQIRKNKNGDVIVKYLQTTAGRVILNYTVQKTLNFL